MIDPTKNKFYGLDKVDTSKTYYVFEGAIDSFFVDNSMAMAGADAKIELLENKENAVIVYDNESRNPEVHFKMEEAMNNGFNVLIWDDNIIQKDVNNMILKEGLTPEYICDIVKNKNNHYTGMEGIVTAPNEVVVPMQQIDIPLHHQGNTPHLQFERVNLHYLSRSLVCTKS